MIDDEPKSIRDDISDVASNPRRLRKEIEGTVLFHNGEYGGYAHLRVGLNRNALAIGLGLEHIAYDPEVFPGLIYRPENLEATVILFEDGQLTVVDAPSESTAEKAIEETVEKVRSLELGIDLPSTVTVNLSKAEADPSIPSVNED